MTFIEQLNNLSTRIRQQKDLAKSEQATINALIYPFFRLLDYDPFDLTEVMPQFTGDVGTKPGEAVDYAFQKDEEVIMIIECKPYGEDLSNHFSQLYRYFSFAPARIGILTDGVMYQFYSDLEEVNKMDNKPFLEFNMLDIQQPLADTLKLFTKSAFDLDKVIAKAKALKYTKEIKDVMKKQLHSPAEDFVRFFMSAVRGVEGQVEVQEFSDYVKQALNQLMSKAVNQPLQPEGKPVHISERPTVHISERPTSVTHKKIIAFRFDGKRYEPKDWTKFLLTFCAILSDKYKNRFEEVLRPNFLGRRRTFFSNNLDDFPKKSSFPQQINGTDIYVQTWLSSDGIRILVWELAKHFKCEDPKIEIAE